MARATLLRRGAPAVLTLCVLGLLVRYLLDNRSYIAETYVLDLGGCVLMACVALVCLLLRGIANRLFFQRLGVNASVRDWFRIATVTAFTNYLPFSAGFFAKGFFLKQVHALSYRLFALGQVALLLLILATNGAVGLATLALWPPERVGGVVGLALAGMIASAGVLLLPQPWVSRLAGRELTWERADVARLRRILPGVAAIQTVILVLAAGGLWLAFGMGAAQVGYPACVIFAATIALTRAVSITPGAIGVREFLVGAVAHGIGFELRDGVIAATLFRAVEMGVVFSLGSVFSFALSNRIAASYERS